MELKKGTKFYSAVPGVGDVEFEITKLLPGGRVEVTGPGGQKQEVPANLLVPETGYSLSATAPVNQLQPDPPAAIARVARNTIASVLPSPVAEPTIKIFNPTFVSAVEDLEPR